MCVWGVEEGESEGGWGIGAEGAHTVWRVREERPSRTGGPGLGMPENS